MDTYLNQLDDWLTKDAGLPRKQRRTAQRLFECLQIEGYRGGYTAVQRHVKDWKQSRTSNPTIKQEFVPLAFFPVKPVSSTEVKKRRCLAGQNNSPIIA